MQSILPTLPTVKAMTAPMGSLPYRVGADDATQGDICCPEMMFTHPADKRAYAAGYASVAGHNATTRQIMGSH